MGAFALAAAAAWELVEVPWPALVNGLAHVAFATAVLLVIRFLTAPERGWDDRHRLALAVGPLPDGATGAGIAPRLDVGSGEPRAAAGRAGGNA